MRDSGHGLAEVAPGILRFRDTCNVYVLRHGRETVLVDFGSGAILDRLGELGVDRVTDVLLTHHHRDQLQGLRRAVAAGAKVWAPPIEVDLVAGVDARWRSRPIDNNYDLRQDRFSLLEGVPVAGAVSEYRTRRYGEFDVYTLPTPGHTVGSVTYFVEVEGRRIGFTGDLLYGDGKVWSLAAMQWSYTGVEGSAATIISCGMLADRAPDVLLPSHGEPIDDPQAALTRLRGHLQELINMRLPEAWNLDEWLRQPFAPITPHLLRNRTMCANNYVLLSESGAALMIDFGYDLTTMTPSTESTGRRSLLWSLHALRREHGVARVEAVATTHYHDDHVAGLNLLREVEGAEVWSPENVAPVLEEPRRYDLPCLWYDPIPVDRVLPLGTPVKWHEYELTAYPLPGHTLYAAALVFDVDGRRVVATGDQQDVAAGPDGRDVLNYQYRNRFRIDDFVRSAELYLSLRPDLLISGHGLPREVTDLYLQRLLADGRRLAELHRELLPLNEVNFGAEGFGARIEPYRSIIRPGEELELDVAVRNPFDRAEVATVRLALPDGSHADPGSHDVLLAAGGEASVRFRVRAAKAGWIAADLTVGEVRFGQQAEALLELE